MIKLTSKYIVPFTYDTAKIEYDKLAQKSNEWCVEYQSKQEKDIFNYIESSLIRKSDESFNNDNTIGCVYRYKKLKQNFRVLYRNRGREFFVYIRKVQLILFQNGVGLLWYTPEKHGSRNFKFENIEEALDFVSDFKELARRKENNYIFMEQMFDYEQGMNVSQACVLPGGK